MFVPRIAKPKTKATASSTSSLPRHSSTLLADRLGYNAGGQVLQRTIGNQATLRLPSQWRVSDGVEQDQKEAQGSMTTREALREVSSDFSKISIFPPAPYRASPPIRVPLLPGAIQTKLAFGQAKGRLEREADQVAGRVMLPSEPKPTSVAPRLEVSRVPQSEPAKAAGMPSGAFDGVLSAAGQPIDQASRAYFEPLLGHDFSKVRVHTDKLAADSAERIGALAYTAGTHIAFAPGQYRPDNDSGRRLLAHKLTHVVQQNSLRKALIQRKESKKVSDPNSIIPIDNLISYVEAVEQAYPADSKTDIVTRIRVEYYSGVAFEQLIPSAHILDFNKYGMGSGMGVTDRKLEKEKVDPEAYKHLTARADENAIEDNPSPYIRLANGEQIDFGHLLLGMDALAHPSTAFPYSDWGVPNIDPAS